MFASIVAMLSYVVRTVLAPLVAVRALLGLAVPPNVHQGFSPESRRKSAEEFKRSYERLVEDARALGPAAGGGQLEPVPFRAESYTSVLLSALNHPTASSPAMLNLSAPPTSQAFEPSLVVVYLHSPLVPRSSLYLSSVFSHPSIRRILQSPPYNNHVWGGDVTTCPEAYTLSAHAFTPRSLPCVVVVTTVELNGSSLIPSEPPSLPPPFDAGRRKRALGACVGRFECGGGGQHEALGAFLQSVAASCAASLKTVGEARGRMWQDRWLRNIQDEEFRRGAEQDLRREESKKEEADKLKVEELTRVSTQNAKREEARKRIREIKARMRSRTSLGGKSVKVRITCPSGRRVDRPFDEDSVVGDIRDFLDLLLHEVRKKARKSGAAVGGGGGDDDEGDDDEETDDAIKPFVTGSAGEQDVADGKIRKYALHTNYPKRTLDDNAKTFKEMGLVGQAVIMVVDLDS